MTEKNYPRIVYTFLFFTLLYLSWQWGVSRTLWNFLDREGYLFFNSWIKSSSLSQTFWALMNHSLNDWLFDLVMLGFVVTYIFYGKTERLYRFTQVFLLVVFCALVTILINRYLLANLIHIRRLSPSLVIENGVRLSHFVKWLKIKETHHACFPSDHSTTTIFFTLIIFHLMGKKYGMVSLLFSILYSLPRLVVGAHWLTDVIIGSFSISACSLALFFYSGALQTWSRQIVQLLQKTHKHEETEHE